VAKPEGKRPLDQDVGTQIILKWIFDKEDMGGMDWINLAQDRDQWRVLVNTVVNLRDSIKKTGGFSRRAQFHGISQLWRNKHTTRNRKINTYDALVTSILTCRSEVWLIPAEKMNRLLATEMAFLKKSAGISWTG
jgi:hypothetical protein